MPDPVTGGLIFLVAGIAGVATYGAYGFVKKVGPQLEAKDLLPLPPPFPPVPRFLYNKELMTELRRR
ncbi:hypothetical protein ES703_67515 [subsurface metagenome]